METKGKKLLKFCGVLFTIEGIIGIISYGLLTLVFSATTIFGKVDGGFAVTAIAVLYLIASVDSLIAGIAGIKKAAGKGSAAKCLAWGIINLIMTFAGTVWSLVGGGIGGITLSHVLFTSIGLIIPSLYIAGAYMNE